MNGGSPAEAAEHGEQASKCTVPEVLITAESMPASRYYLANVDAEATAIQAAFGGAANAEVARNISISELDRLLAGRTTWFFLGHGDAMLQSELVLAFVGVGGEAEVVSVDTLMGIVRPHVLTGKLKLIVLNGVRTARLAAALRERASVPYVVCWETVVFDDAARIFGTAFAQAIADGAEPPVAFEKARTAVCAVTEPGNLDTGPGARVQKFDLDVDPMDGSRVNARDGRLRHHPGAPRGRIAAGIPKLFRFEFSFESTALHDVPTLPAHVPTVPLTGTFARFDTADFKDRLAATLQLQVKKPDATTAQEEKPAQAVWDTSDLSGSLEPAAYNPYAAGHGEQASKRNNGPAAVAVPEVLITAESQPATRDGQPNRAHLPDVDAEVTAIQAALGGAANAEVQRNVSVSELDRLLAGRTTWFFSGHTDAKSEPALCFVGAGGEIEALSVDTFVGIVRPHVLTGRLKLIVINGSGTARLAAALRERAFVPYVLCWETAVRDEAARIFGTAFAQAIASGAEPPIAFERARTAVCAETEPGNLKNVFGARVQKFELDVDPRNPNYVNQATTRLLHHPGAPRGRLAAGTPKLLCFESTTLHDVPSLPTHYMPRPEERDLRDALVNGVRGDGTVVGGVGPSFMVSIVGAAGLGKSTTASWLARDPCVSSAFREGVFWLEFGNECTAMQRLVRLAELLTVPSEELDRLERGGMDLLRDEVARRLKDRSCLIILDDVWDEQQPEPFRQLAGGRVVVLMTTRKRSIIDALGEQLARLELRSMQDEASTRLQGSGKAAHELHGSQAIVPEVLITCESQPPTLHGQPNGIHLPNVDAEATAIQAAFGGAANAEVARNISISELDRLLAGRTTWFFLGHGDAMLQSELVLAFVGVGGEAEVVSVDTLMGIVRPHVLTGKLKLIVLNGVCTARLAAVLRERTSVPCVLCWETVVHDEAARIFGTAFAQAIASGAEPPDAFEKARTAVCAETELDADLGAWVQKFELNVDPKDATLVDQTTCRLRHHPGVPRGRIAAGTPKLLCLEGD